MYTIGAFLAPLIMSPFLAKANEGESSTEAACPGEDAVEIEPSDDAKLQIIYGFSVTCAITSVVGVFWVLLTVLKVLEQIKEDHQDVADTREEEDFKTIWPFLATVVWYFFNIETTEVIFGAYLYDYARCSELTGDFETSSASQLLTLFWGMMMVGRFAGIFVASRLSPTVYAYIDLILTVIGITLLAIEPITGKPLTYAVTALVGLSLATVYGSGVSITATRINVSDSYMWIFFFSAQLMTMFNPILCSHLMESSAENFVYMNITTTTLGLIGLPVLVRSYKWLRNKGVLKSPSKSSPKVIDEKSPEHEKPTEAEL